MKFLIVGQGKSGTTALLETISQQIWVKPRFKYMEPRDLRLIEMDATVVCKKTIEKILPEEADVIATFDRKVLIVRDPRDVLISRLLYVGYKKDAFLQDENVEKFSRILSKKRHDRARSFRGVVRSFAKLTGIDVERQVVRLNGQVVEFWRQCRDTFCLVKYEDFVAGTAADLEEYLGFSVSADVTVDSKFARVARAKRSGDWRRWFSEDDVDYYKNLFRGFFTEFSYEVDAPLENVALPAEEAENYFVRVVNDGRAKLGVGLYGETKASDALAKK